MGRAAELKLSPPTLDELRAARDRVSGHIVRTPLLRLPPLPGEPELWLKLETLQPIGSFKLRGAANALGRVAAESLARGVYTASAGNMAQGVAWCARAMGVPCTVVVPDHAPRAKLEAVERLGARIVPVPFARWWQVMVERRYEGLEGHFVHPVSDPDVIAGNGTLGLELLEDLPGLANVLVPYGGGGLSCGVAAALRAAGSSAQVFGCEVETAAPLSASFRAREPRTIDYRASFVDGIGGRSLLEEMWPLASTLLAGALLVSLEEIAAAIRLLVARVRVVAEGAGAAGVAAALSGRPATGLGGDSIARSGGPTVCVVSGGNIDVGKLATILEGRLP
ncbi:MAG TPA: pyridoxal-phosphate dependent enzyme [Candidatus Sulfotelmatobacter sp.]|nr:pyridoxal-phosphate dependent enzyme [Candidatus Sulfotelmatobacter sp.]